MTWKFYLFAISATCWSYMVIGPPLLHRIPNIGAEGICCMVSRVVKMGWRSSVGIAQHWARKLGVLVSPRGAEGLPAASQMRKDMSLHGAFGIAQQPTWQEHLDNLQPTT